MNLEILLNYTNKMSDLIANKIVPNTDIIMVVLLIICGLYYSFLTRFVQFRMLGSVFKILTEKNTQNSKEHISPFEALMISTASRVGIGNIAGISLALTTGGAGALFWMWVMAFFGGASAFAESTLAQIYKTKDKTGGFKGGPAYYIKKALGSHFFGSFFAFILIITYAYGFNGLQSQTMTSSFKVYYDMFYPNASIDFASSSWPIIIGIILTLFGAWMFFSHHTKIGKISSLIVPFMALAYILLASIAVLINFDKIPLVVHMILENAFDFKAIFGGFAGSALVIGIKRGLFSNEAGMGSAPNAAAAALTSHPVKQGLIQSFSVLIDVIICTSSGFLVLFSMAYLGFGEGKIEGGMPLIQETMREYYGGFGIHFITLAIVLFAITSLIGNYYYAQANVKYLTHSKLIMNLFRISAVAMIFIGSQMNLKFAWNLADLTMAFMAITNIISLLLLGGIVNKVLKDFNDQQKKGLDPQFSASKLGIKNAQCWE
ncbi:alanine:cation symporter family protein [Campylobacter hepaticus]|uniref:Alanine:cation symporter family protein n=1 Tax=Campylobacter hepaticus TaxID=1813019 RepID=A0A424Z2T5_9BACT|nr:sodium:alanine symporter family protein [Campylobacter hepaticus]MDX2323365.1 sodium:alanine symporter family protein [Campylobacter hepaticus]MDX2332625.1 sodium:alanine symporter family protein [Campylobacter hepaticus]MDX2409614.1 sodium:alanine symporter family protein [Campylobacter hepaticus]RQD67044.1 alanine:cation symporter family protein [Campylobacter hepaticus]RQD88530.1 alanine:cation symporter family protein [Campylobacter hepaticus]